MGMDGEVSADERGTNIVMTCIVTGQLPCGLHYTLNGVQPCA